MGDPRHSCRANFVRNGVGALVFEMQRNRNSVETAKERIAVGRSAARLGRLPILTGCARIVCSRLGLRPRMFRHGYYTRSLCRILCTLAIMQRRSRKSRFKSPGSARKSAKHRRNSRRAERLFADRTAHPILSERIAEWTALFERIRRRSGECGAMARAGHIAFFGERIRAARFVGDAGLHSREDDVAVDTLVVYPKPVEEPQPYARPDLLAAKLMLALSRQACRREEATSIPREMRLRLGRRRRISAACDRRRGHRFAFICRRDRPRL